MSKYLVCTDATNVELTYGETYLCYSCHREGFPRLCKVYNTDVTPNYKGRFSSRRFVTPQEFEKSHRPKPETYFDVVNCGSRKLNELISELEQVEKKRSKIIKELKTNYEKIGKQLELI